MSCTRSRPPSPRSILILVVALWSALLPGGVDAASVAEVRAQVAELQRAGTTALKAQEPVLEAFEAWAKQFYALTQKGNDAGARELFEQIHPPMKQLYEHNRSRTEAMVQATIKADGDLEATQAAPEFRDAEVARLRILYNLNWVSYLGATLLPESDARRKPLLVFAAEGFGEFVVGPDEAIARESLFGRAQAQKGLAKSEEALADLRRIVQLGPSTPYYAQARTSVAEALLGAGRGEEAAREAGSVIADAAAGSLPAGMAVQGRLLRAQALFLSLKQNQAAAGQRAAHLREALSLLREVERQGGAWQRKAQVVASWGLEGLPEADMAAGSGLAGLAVAQSLMMKGKHAEALAQLEAAIANPGTSADQRNGAHFYAGLSAFQLKRHAVAAKHLHAFLQTSPRDADAPEAAYLLFKALEQVAREQPSPQADTSFRQALRGFADGYPQHPGAAEARFRMAELLRDDGDVLASVEEFRKVKGNRTLEFYAEFNAAQAMFARLRTPPPSLPAEQIERERGQAITALEGLIGRLDQVKRAGATEVPADELGAKAAVMAAILASEGAAPDYRKALELTKEFGKRFPGRPELTRQAFAIEVLALQKVSDPARAEQAVTAYLDSFGGDERARRQLLKRLGREFFVQAEAERANGQAELASASSHIAIAIYRKLLGEVEVSSTTASARRGLHAMLGKLYAGMGENQQATENYVAVLDIDPRSEEALKGLAEIAAKTGDHAKATRYWELLAGLMDPKDPDWLDARYAAAKSAGAAGNVQAGCRFVRETSSLSPYPLVGEDKARFGDLERRLCGG